MRVAGSRWLATLCVMFALGCTRERATKDACRMILSRIIELELHERGFHDPALVARKRAELERELGKELRTCEGRVLPAGALACVARARSAEQISHRCLR